MRTIPPFAGVNPEVPIAERLAAFERAALEVSFTGAEMQGHIVAPQDHAYVVTPHPGSHLVVAHSGMVGCGDGEGFLFKGEPSVFERGRTFIGHVVVPTLSIDGLKIAVRSYSTDLGLQELRSNGFQYESGHFLSTEFTLGKDQPTLALVRQ